MREDYSSIWVYSISEPIYLVFTISSWQCAINSSSSGGIILWTNSSPFVMSKIKKLSILIPVYNEIRNVEDTINKVAWASLPSGVEKEVIIVDDASTDGTRELLQKLSERYVKDGIVKIYFHGKNRGKWGAIRTAIEYVTGDYILIQDADSEYDVLDYVPMVNALSPWDKKIIYGSRRLGHNNQYSHVSYFFGGVLLSWMTNILYGQDITDEPTCYKLIPTELIKGMNLQCERFEFCPEVTAKLSRMGEKIHEVPIKYYPRSIHEGKKIRWKDWVEAIVTLLRYRFWKP